MTAEEFLTHLDCVRRSGKGWAAKCPAHDDRRASLSVSQGEKGVLFHCHAGCDFERVVGALGLEPKDLMPWKGDHSDGCRAITDTYDYKDADGSLLFQVVRYAPKNFRQRRPDGHGGWLWNLDGTRRVPYRLPQLLAADPAQPVFIVEGEKDVDRLFELGLLATTNPSGAGKWNKISSDSIQNAVGGRTVFIIPDNDVPGRRHGAEVRDALIGIAAAATVVPLPGLPPKGDVSDWLDADGSAEELLRICQEAARRPVEQGEPEVGAGVETRPEERFTDLGNARRFTRHHGKDVRYSFHMEKWLVFDGKRWAKDESGRAESLAQETVEAMHREALALPDGDEKRDLRKWALASESAGHIRAMLELARPSVSVQMEDLDRDPWLLNLKNGTLDLRSGALRKHRREDQISRLAPVDYDPDAISQTFDAFLKRIMADAEMIAFLQRAVGYSLTGDISEQVMLIPYGLGRNGKSTLLTVVGDMLGDYAATTPPETLMVKFSDGPSNDVARLAGARLVISIEAEEARRLAESRIKLLTGGDRVSARFLYGEYFEFIPQFKIWFATNYKPAIHGTEEAIWRRIRLIPFDVTIPEPEVDHRLPDKLRTELPGILSWAIAGCLKWQATGLATPNRVEQATSDYRAEEDILGQFIADCCRLEDGAEAASDALYGRFVAWSEQQGYKRPLNQNTFGRRLTGKGFRLEKAGGRRVRVGLTLSQEDSA